MFRTPGSCFGKAAGPAQVRYPPPPRLWQRLPWPAYRAGDNYPRMRIDVKSQAEPEGDRDRYLALEATGATR